MSLPSYYTASTKEPRDPPFNKLCDQCREDFPPGQTWTWTRKCCEDIQNGTTVRISSTRKLIDSAKGGCHLCILILGAFHETFFARIDGKIYGFDEGKYQLQAVQDIPGWTLKLFLDCPILRRLSDLSFPSDDLRVDLLLLLLHDQPKEFNTGKDVWVLDTTRAGTISQIDSVQIDSVCNLGSSGIIQIKTWIEVCQRDHQVCKNRQDIPFSATEPQFRLIDVGNSVESTVYLVNSGDIVGDFNYITLSHRWKEETHKTKLTRSNLHQYLTCMPYMDWPATFRQTISIARQLQIKYVWIDSLCIIQDKQDWAVQSQLMHRIYAGGVLNLAEVATPTMANGLQVYRDPLEISPCILSGRAPEYGTSVRHFLCWRPNEFRDRVDNSPLYQRGWTFQERLLSKRTVHFGPQLYWECAALHASETFPIGVDTPDQPTFVDDFVQRLKTQLQTPRQGADKAEAARDLHSIWCSIVSFYSKTELEKESDRLVAISGIATSIMNLYAFQSDDYIAATWKPCLPEQLLWARDENCSHWSTDKGNFDYAPSWSWASCTGRTRFTKINFQPPFGPTYLIRVDSIGDFEKLAGIPQKDSMLLGGNLISVVFKPEIWERRRAERKFYVAASEVHKNTSSNSQILIELDIPVPSCISHTKLLPVWNELGTLEGLFVGLMKEASNEVAVYRRLGYFICQSHDLYGEAGVCMNELESETKHILETTPQFKLE
jgi:hypothetical protein